MVRPSALLLACLVLSAQQQPLGQGVNFYSYEKEAALGATLTQETRQRTIPLDSSTVHDYVDRLGRQLATQLPDTHFTYTFAVITDAVGGRTHEPISLPGGYIFVPTNLILAAQNEAEFAGMLAHAIVHVAARHGTRTATRGQLANQASIPLIFMGGSDSSIPIGFLSFQRANELEADRRAVGMLAGAGYDPNALIRYITRVQPPNTPAQELHSALPAVDKRLAAMEEAIQKLAARSYASHEEFQTIQEEVRRLQPPPPAPSLLRNRN